MSKVSGRLITYCSNIHPGERWAEVFDALRANIPVVKAAVAPDRPFPIGLRLSLCAADALDAARSARFRDWLDEVGGFVPTLNGFPYGDFHGERVKEAVYLPDWRSPERAAYTMRLADLLQDWLPDGMRGSISTVPLGFKGMVQEADLPEIHARIRSVLTHLAAIRERTGREILLALEPEPGCLLETTDEVCCFFAEIDLAAEQRDLLGICYDCCHQAVEFEDPAASLAMLSEAGVKIAKVQVSSALRVTEPALLERFAESRYLHQVVVRGRDGASRRYPDLDQALQGPRVAGEEWRCHFHVPIFLPAAGPVGTTRDFLDAILPLLEPELLLEVETYTWDVLPPELRLESVTDSIVREIHWLEDACDARSF